MTRTATASPDPVLVARPVTPTTILARDLDQLCRELRVGTVLDAETLERLHQARELAAGLDPYLDRCTTAESPALAALARRTRATDWQAEAVGAGRLEQEMLSGHVEGQTLKFLLHLASATRVLDIGMFTGYSALAMAEALPEDGVVIACELDPTVAAFAREQFAQSPAGHKIRVSVGPARDTLRRLAEEVHGEPGQRFDFVFVDADKAGYLDYVEFLLTSDLLAPRAIIAVDNTLLQGQPYVGQPRSVNGTAIAEFNAAVAADPRVEQVLIPLRDGLTLIRRTPR